jgi:predicted LPLAT superfamily acyltransferase
MDSDEEELLYHTARLERGVLLIGSHFGNLEYSRAVAHRHHDLIINILLYDRHAANFASLVGSSVPESRLNLIQVTDLDIELALRLKEKVDAGEWVLIAGDRVPVGDSDNVAAANFLGRPAPFPIGPYVLGGLLDCPVYLLHCYRDGEQYRLGMEHFADKIQAERINGVRNYNRYVQRYAMMLERLVCRQPLQWFNFYDFWRRGNTAAQLTASLRDNDPD